MNYVGVSYFVCIEGYLSIILLSCPIATGAIKSSGLFPSYSMMVLSLYIASHTNNNHL